MKWHSTRLGGCLKPIKNIDSSLAKAAELHLSVKMSHNYCVGNFFSFPIDRAMKNELL